MYLLISYRRFKCSSIFCKPDTDFCVFRLCRIRLVIQFMELIAGLCFATAVQGATIQPGNWRKETTFTSVSTPGISTTHSAALKALIGKPQIETGCMALADMRSASFAVAADGCQPDMTFVNGRISGTRTCKASGYRRTSSVTGSYSLVSFSMVLKVTDRLSSGVEGTTSATFTGKWLGPTCK
jgi:Protein of unknown function (DUF3617)